MQNNFIDIDVSFPSCCSHCFHPLSVVIVSPSVHLRFFKGVANQNLQESAGLRVAYQMCSMLVSDPTPLKKGQPQQLGQAWIDWYVHRDRTNTLNSVYKQIRD